jgi:uncharacterized hydrophobic protein (TIGR00271 family)
MTASPWKEGALSQKNTEQPQTAEVQRDKLYLVHDSTLEPQSLEGIPPELAITFLPWNERETPPAEACVLIFLGDEQIRDLAPLALERQWQVGILPHAEAHQATTALGVKGDLPELLAHYAGASAIGADALTCNGELVFSSVVIGQVLALRPYDINRPQTTWSLLKGAMKGLRKLRLKPYKLVTGKEREINIAALGLVAVSHTQSSLVGRTFDEDLGIADGRLSLLALAPRSIVGYLLFLLRLLWPGKISLSKLPASLALIQTNQLSLTSPEGTEYLLDGKPVHATEIEFQVLEQRLQLLPGPALKSRAEEKPTSEKETVRLNDMPVDESVKPMVDTPHLPLFSHATEEEYRELFTALRGSANASSSYQVLMVLSVLLALTGLYANSAPVIIGAMILAPLMSPVVSLAMGMARTELGLVRTSLRTLVIGVAWGLGCAILLAWAMPLDLPTDEMRSRMSPTLLDLLVAVISGIAGAYASAKEEIARSLAGVAIAVALVPPLAVAGIALGWGQWDMAGGALLLLITNLVGIALAAAATFLVLGFAPFHRARRGLAITLGMLLVIAIPLYVSFSHLVEKDRLQSQIPHGEMTLSGVPIDVTNVSVKGGKPWVVRLVLSSPERLDESHVEELKQVISERVGYEVLVEAQFSIRR